MATHRHSSNPAKPAKIIHEFGNLQDHLHNHVIRHNVNQIVKHIRDPKIVCICQEIADFMEIEIIETFKNEDMRWFKDGLKNLTNHLKQANQKYAEIVQMLPNYDSQWTEGLYRATEKQLIYLSQLIVRLDREPSVYDKEGNEILPGSLVVYPCEDQEGRKYDHYGVVMHSAKGLVVRHFFSGPTVKGRNQLIEKGIGYVHSVTYTSEWIFKEHPPENITYQEIQKRIETSNQILNKIWNKFSYNCEHWAREMVTGVPKSYQAREWANQQKKS